jgi:glycine/D-amino acid oxidase-like deaminating enzyme
MPFSRVDPVLLAQALPRCLAALAVRRVSATVTALEPLAAGGWRLNTDHAPVVAERVVLAAGASCRDLWPELPLQWRFSWAGVLALADWQGSATSAWLDQGRRGRIVLPRRLRRPAFEASSALLRAPEWIVDPGLAPWGSGGLLGQITLAGPGLDPARPPDPMEMEERLRQGLGTLDPQLAEQPGQYRQVAVPFCLDGRPITASLAPDLWAFSGFSGAFATVPPLAEQLAAVLLNS